MTAIEMSGDPNFRLWYLIDGERTPISFIASPTLLIDEVKGIIKEMNVNVLRTVDAGRLTLWKVRYFSWF